MAKPDRAIAEAETKNPAPELAHGCFHRGDVRVPGCLDHRGFSHAEFLCGGPRFRSMVHRLGPGRLHLVGAARRMAAGGADHTGISAALLSARDCQSAHAPFLDLFSSRGSGGADAAAALELEDTPHNCGADSRGSSGGADCFPAPRTPPETGNCRNQEIAGAVRRTLRLRSGGKVNLRCRI